MKIEFYWLKKSWRAQGLEERHGMIELKHPKLSVARQCELLELPRSTCCQRAETDENLEWMKVIDEVYLAYPFFGSRQMTRWLEREGHWVNRKRVRRLMAAMGLEAIYRRPNLSKASKAHPVYPYLLRELAVSEPNQVWATDVTYIPVRGGYVYLCAVIDWHSRYVLAWDLSNTLDASFYVRAVARAMAVYGVPEIFNPDQGCQFTRAEFTQPLLAAEAKLSIDGKGRCLDNVFVERLWRSLKYEEVYLERYVDMVEANRYIADYMCFYNEPRPHSAHGRQTPSEVYRQAQQAA